MDSQGRKLHGQVAEIRESGDSVKALSMYPEVLEAYLQDGDSAGFAEALADQFLTLRHLYEKTSKREWLILAEHSAQAAIDIAREQGSKEALAVPLFNLAKSQETLGELNEAVATYKEALENMQNNPPESHANRPAIIAD